MSEWWMVMEVKLWRKWTHGKSKGWGAVPHEGNSCRGEESRAEQSVNHAGFSRDNDTLASCQHLKWMVDELVHRWNHQFNDCFANAWKKIIQCIGRTGHSSGNTVTWKFVTVATRGTAARTIPGAQEAFCHCHFFCFWKNTKTWTNTEQVQFFSVFVKTWKNDFHRFHAGLYRKSVKSSISRIHFPTSLVNLQKINVTFSSRKETCENFCLFLKMKMQPMTNCNRLIVSLGVRERWNSQWNAGQSDGKTEGADRCRAREEAELQMDDL